MANLVLWKVEPFLQAKLAAQGITYSRYVDDMAMSSTSYLNKAQQNAAIAHVYGMLSKEGLRAGRGKHEIFAASKPMIVTKLVVNRKPSLPTKKRSAVRTQVFQLEQLAAKGGFRLLPSESIGLAKYWRRGLRPPCSARCVRASREGFSG